MEARLMKMNGCLPDEQDDRDRKYRELRPQNRLFKAITRPKAKYLKELNLPSVYNQGAIGSCVGHGVTTCVAYAVDYNESRLDGLKPRDYSRLFAYYNARGNKHLDEGATIRDGVKGVAQHGLCLEEHWPYVEGRFAVKPPDAAYKEGAKRRAVSYYRVASISDMIDCIAQGYPVVFGMTIFDGFMDTGADGRFQWPREGEASLGGHCMVIVGYSLTQKAFYVRNSWGPRWGERGNCWVPFEYLRVFGGDCWTVRAVTPAAAA